MPFRRLLRTAPMMTLCLCVSFAGLLPGSAVVPDVMAQENGGATVKSRARLKAPEGATNKKARGKAKTVFRNRQGNVKQRLVVKAKNLEAQAQYQIRVDGVDLGAHTTDAEGTLRVRLSDPVRDGSIALPSELMPVTNLRTVEVLVAGSGELALSGELQVGLQKADVADEN